MKFFNKLRRIRTKSQQAFSADYPDIEEPDFHAALALCRQATMTSIERLYALHNAVQYIVSAGISGAFVECGVWKGGSVMMMALTLRKLGVTDRDIFLFDTFAGPPPAGKEDTDFTGVSMAALETQGVTWPRSPASEVQTNLATTGYPMERFHLIPGDVLQTIPQYAPRHIALLRLDTDWYESTRHEMEHLFPRVGPRGAVIIDDYGHFRGARQAVDEYFTRHTTRHFLHRIDYSARMLIKT